MMNRAYVTFAVKTADDEQRCIEGIASTPHADRVGDVVEPSGAVFKTPMPLLWQHRADEPIGEVRAVKVDKQGIHVRAYIPKGITPRIDEAWALIKAGLVRGLSIGFKPLAFEPVSKDPFSGQRFTKWEWLELSAVTIPANMDASITAIKALDADALAALGTPASAPPSHHPPGVSGSTTRMTRASTAMKKSLSERVADWRDILREKSDRITQMIEQSSDSGVTFDEAQQEEHKTLSDACDEIEKTIKILEAQEAREKSLAKPVDVQTGLRVSGNGVPQIQVVEQKLPKGIRFARLVLCKAAAVLEARTGNFVSPVDIAKARYPDDSLLRNVIEKTAVGAGTAAVTSNNLTDLVPYNAIASDFVEYLRPRTIIGQFGTGNIPPLHNVPFNVRVGGFSAGFTGYWVGEGLPTPVSKATSTAVTLTWSKVAGLCVLTEELVRFSSPSAEARVRDDLARAVAARMDIDFIDPEKAAVANVSPASITRSVVAIAPTGTTAAKFRADLATMLSGMVNVPGRRVLIMSETMATTLSMMINTLGNPDFGGLTPEGGTINGIPVIVSEHLTSVGSPGTQAIVLVTPSEIMLADDGQATVEASTEASIEMLDSSLVQTAVAGTGASLVNMWQTNSVAIRAVRFVNWAARRSGAVAYISPAAYLVQ